ncbi:hypothetical protein NDU88_011881 [Pleurodeles waltl]|uniref:Uncharacterized protein n=1 Tax=Pleurodeles waltl TaxID=8319 RepID=A0AAV7R4N6_PLEWA|nr:hypothetical protein NDU88_011881 [Pleurodeles waltl]
MAPAGRQEFPDYAGPGPVLGWGSCPEKASKQLINTRLQLAQTLRERMAVTYAIKQVLHYEYVDLVGRALDHQVSDKKKAASSTERIRGCDGLMHTLP